ncbi:hypothetical protein [Streptomyces sp. YU58]|uniref:hypothetical protein n=1 Tax=Streptomyces sp. SX92 TaxID=3158972 RepID=UPI0027B901FB|nr:hypothetical protein [Streptomyces coralus]WLW57035.1 hypothetical protein QU709_39250 [Streptomyces coralus]
MATSAEEENIVVMQVGDRPVRVERGLTAERCREMVSKADVQAAQRMEAVEARLAAVTAAVADPNRAVEYYQLQLAKARSDEEISLQLEELPSEEHFNLVTELRQNHEIGSTIFYANTKFGGSHKFLGTPWPNLKWWPYKFNDKASSVKNWGVHVACEHHWWKGRKLWLVGVPFVQFEDLGVFGMNDTITSYA